jgi:hypothetical protein
MMMGRFARHSGPSFFNASNTPGYSTAGLRSLNRAREIIMAEHGLDMEALPADVVIEIDQHVRDRLTRYGADMPVRALLACWAA